MALNILEAVVSDFQRDFIMNAVLGIGLVATLGSYKLIHKSSDHDQCMIWPIERLWVVAYSAWNLAFVSRMYPGHYSDHFVILGIPIIFMIWCNGLWLQTRAYILSLYALAIITLEKGGYQIQWPDSIGSMSPLIYNLIVSVAYCCLGIIVVKNFLTKKKLSNEETYDPPD